MWDLSYLTMDQTMPPEVEAQILNHWTTREVPQKYIFKLKITLLLNNAKNNCNSNIKEHQHP